MKHLINLSYIALISLALAAFTLAQSPAPTPAGDKPLPSLKTLPAKAKFTSPDKRFTIALPKDIAEFEALKPNADSPKETGGKYAWVLKEGVISIDYSEDPDLVIKSEKDYADLAEGMRGGVAVFNGTVLSEGPIKVSGYRGYEIKFSDPSKLTGVTRMIIVGPKKYTLFCLAFPDVPGGMELAVKALDTFAVVRPPVRKKAVKKK